MPIDPSRYADALRFALKAHGVQARKGSEVPYITHPVAVSAALAQYGYGEDLVLAGLLHDTVEDAGVTPAEITAFFGGRVAFLVAGVTEEKRRDGERVPWRERKEAQLAHLDTADSEILALKAADTLHNMESILRDLRIHGPAVWARFNASREQQVWYYRSVAEHIAARLGPDGLPGELLAAAEELGRVAENNGDNSKYP